MSEFIVKERRQGKRLNWDIMYPAAADYYYKHGNLDVPVHYISDNNIRLGRWITNLRYAYRKKDPCLTEERIALLNELGMSWKVLRLPSWEDFYGMAAEYYAKHGHLDLHRSSITEKGYKLGAWLYKMKKIKSSSLTEDQIRRLKLIGIKKN